LAKENGKSTKLIISDAQGGIKQQVKKINWDRKLFRIVLLNASPAADISGR
jgi:hypothetical protein